jgi:hypothetical protein
VTAKLEQALIQHFIDAGFGLPIAYENSEYTPEAGTAYVHLGTFVNDTTTLSLNTSDQTDGLLQVILRYPEDGYSWDAKNKADAISAVFKLGLRLENDGQRLTVIRRSQAPGVNEAGWYKIVLRVFFIAVLPRN